MPNSTYALDGDYTWTELAPPALGGGVYVIHVAAEDDVWFFGRDILRWQSGEAVRVDLEAAGIPGPPDYGHYIDTVAFRSPSDIWACGSALWYFDGTTWTERTSLLADAVPEPTIDLFNRCEVAGDETSLFVAYQTISVGPIPANGGGATSVVTSRLVRLEGGQAVALSQVPETSGVPTLFLRDGELFQVGNGKIATTPMGQSEEGLKGSNYPWARKGDRLVSWSVGAFENGIAITDATIPGDFVQVEEMPLAFFDFLDESAAPPGLAPSLGQVTVSDVMITDDGGLTYLMNSNDGLGRFGFFVRYDADGTRLLPDRLYGYAPGRFSIVGDELIVATISGGVLRGSPK